MDYQGVRARLKDLKTAELAALRRGDKKAADRCRERTFSLRNKWTCYQASLYSHAETSNMNEREVKEVDDDDETYQGDESSCGGESEDDENDEEGQESNDDNDSGGRQKRECPVPSCDSKVVHLPRHLRNVHKWNEVHARTAVSRLGLRKKYQFSDEEKAMAGNRKVKKETTERKCQRKPCRKKKICPLKGCMTTTDRLPQHLQRVHKMQRTDAKYTKALSMAKIIARDKPHVFLRMKQARQRDQERDGDESSVMSVDESDGGIEMTEEDNSVDSDNSEAKINEGSHDSRSEAFEKAETQGEDVSKTLRSFRDWLLSPDGGKKDGKTAKQHVSQVNKVLSVVGEGTLLSSLIDSKKIRDTFLQQYAAKKYHAATIKSYLMSLQHYCSFLLADQPGGVTFDKENVLSLREKLKRWSSSYKRENTRRRWEKMEEDRSALITPEKIREFERSQAAREAIVLLGKLCGAHTIQITQEMYTLVRDYLIAQIMIDNANRAGVVAYMTVKEFDRATVEGDRHVVRVLHHKTVDTHGPAQIVLTSHLYNYISVFMQEMRSQLPDLNRLDKQTVFLSWCGKSMESSQMTKALGSVFKKAGVDGRVHHTLYRKSAVSRCHERHKEISSNLADLMAHQEETAQKYYRVFEKSKSSVKASQTLHGIMRNTDESSENLQPTQTSLPEATKDDTKIQEGQNPRKPERVPWKEESINAIQTLFAEEIAAQNITFTGVKEKLRVIQYCLRKIQNECMTRSGRSGDSTRNWRAAAKKR